MIYNLKVSEEAVAANKYLQKLLDKSAKVEVKEIRKTRSLNQNSYLHLLLGAFGLHFGYNLEEAKLVYKQVNSSLYLYKKDGFLMIKSSADLDTKEMTRSIDRFKEWSNEHGCYLPPANNEAELQSIQNAIERSGYL